MSTDDVVRPPKWLDPSPPCPVCGGSEVAHVVWGLPTAEAFEAARHDAIDFGGCCMTPEAPDFHCRTCDHTWQLPR